MNALLLFIIQYIFNSVSVETTPPFFYDPIYKKKFLEKFWGIGGIYEYEISHYGKQIGKSDT